MPEGAAGLYNTRDTHFITQYAYGGVACKCGFVGKTSAEVIEHIKDAKAKKQ